jgi:fructose-1,6-bisphosphatase/inositol monophosphatase family enzyme
MASLSLGNVPDHPVPDLEPFDIKATLRRMEEIRAGLRAAAAAEGRPILEVPPLPPMTEQEQAAERELLARLRSQFKGPPLTSEEIIAAIGRDSHPPELDRFGIRIHPAS